MLFLLIATAKAFEFVDQNASFNMTYELNETNHTASLISFEIIQDIDIINIPATVNRSYKVISIAPGCFMNGKYNGSVIFNENLEYIGNYSFGIEIEYKWSNMDCGITGHLKIPNSVKIICDSAFVNSRITSFEFGDNSKLEAICDHAFANCTSLFGKIPNNLPCISLGNATFYQTSISGRVDGRKFKISGNFSFAHTLITEFIFANDTTIIRTGAFAYSKLSGDLVLPNSVKVIEKYAFEFTLIRGLNFPSSLEIIRKMAFFSCEYLTSSLPKRTYDKIGEDAFCGSMIKADVIRCKNISKGSFAYCNGLIGDIEVNADFVNEGAFQGCENILTIKFNTGCDIPNYLMQYCFALKSFVINNTGSNSVTRIVGKGAFSYCEKLQEISLPETLTRIEERAFFECHEYSDNYNLSYYPNLTSIGKEAYHGCDNLYGELILPYKLEEINTSAFTECLISGSIFIPNSVKTIGKYAFFKCTHITGYISLGNSLTSIGDSAFSMCTGISGNLMFGENITHIGDSAFFGCSSISGNLNLPSSLIEIGNSAFYGCSNLKGSLHLPSKLKTIGVSSFAECTGFTGVLIIPKSVEIVKRNAFFNCKGFYKVEFENSSVDVRLYSFSNLHVKCFSNVPDSFRTNKTQERYSSDNFNGLILQPSILNLNCSLFYAIDVFLMVIVFLVIFIPLLFITIRIIKILINNKTNTHRLKAAFKEMIEKEKKGIYSKSLKMNIKMADGNNHEEQLNNTVEQEKSNIMRDEQNEIEDGIIQLVNNDQPNVARNREVRTTIADFFNGSMKEILNYIYQLIERNASSLYEDDKLDEKIDKKKKESTAEFTKCITDSLKNTMNQRNTFNESIEQPFKETIEQIANLISQLADGKLKEEINMDAFNKEIAKILNKPKDELINEFMEMIQRRTCKEKKDNTIGKEVTQLMNERTNNYTENISSFLKKSLKEEVSDELLKKEISSRLNEPRNIFVSSIKNKLNDERKFVKRSKEINDLIFQHMDTIIDKIVQLYGWKLNDVVSLISKNAINILDEEKSDDQSFSVTKGQATQSMAVALEESMTSMQPKYRNEIIKNIENYNKFHERSITCDCNLSNFMRRLCSWTCRCTCFEKGEVSSEPLLQSMLDV